MIRPWLQMKKQFKKKTQKLNSNKLEELAEDFGAIYDKKVQITVLPNGAVGYKNFIIKPGRRGAWTIFYSNNLLDPVGEYNLKSCALMAAKAYNTVHINKFFEIKDIDTRYNTNYTEYLLFKQHIKVAKDLDRYIILLNKLEEADRKTQFYKDRISTMFRNTFA
jgi:hypothetical protein